MAAEIASIPQIVARQLEAHGPAYAQLGRDWRAAPPRFFVTCARGTSDQAALFFKYLTEIGTGTVVVSLGPSLGSVFEADLRLEGSAALAISQSGASPDLVALLRRAAAGGARTVALVNTLPSPLAEVSHTALPLEAGEEKAVAATKSFVASLVAITAIHAAQTADASLAAALSGLPGALEAALARPAPDLGRIGQARSIFTLGRGLSSAAAGEGALKLKETCLFPAEAMSTAEFRHGPLALARPGTAAILFLLDDATRRGNQDLARTLRDRGVDVLSIGPGDADHSLPTTGFAPLDLIVSITAFYRAVHVLSVSLGHDPDAPPHLAKATHTL